MELGIDFYLRNHGIEKLIADYTANDMRAIELGCRQLCMENRGINKEKPLEQIEKQGMEKLLKILQYTITRLETIEKDYYFKIEALDIKSKVGLDCRIYKKIKT